MILPQRTTRNHRLMQLLTPEELKAVTGAATRKLQAAVLDNAGIFYWTRHDGTVATTWHHVNHPRGAGAKTRPNYDAA